MSVLRCPARPAVSGSSVWGTHASSSLAQSGANRVLVEGRNRNRWSFAPLWVHVVGTEWDFDRSSAERSTPTSAECFARGFVWAGRASRQAGRLGRPRRLPSPPRALAAGCRRPHVSSSHLRLASAPPPPALAPSAWTCASSSRTVPAEGRWWRGASTVQGK